MLEKQTALTKKGDFDRIEIIAEMHEQTLRRLNAGFTSKLLYTGLYNPQWPPTVKEFTADMNAEGGSLRLEDLHAQLPPPPQYDVSPQRSLAASTTSDEPGVRQAVTQQTEQEGNFSFQAGVDGRTLIAS